MTDGMKKNLVVDLRLRQAKWTTLYVSSATFMAFFMRNGANCRLSCCSSFASFPIEILKSNQHHLPTNDLNPFLHKNTFWKSFPKVHFSWKIDSFFFIKDIDINVVSKCVYECFLMPSVMCTDGMHDQLFVCDAWPIRWRGDYSSTTLYE